MKWVVATDSIIGALALLVFIAGATAVVVGVLKLLHVV